MDEEHLQKRIERTSWVVLALLTGAGLAFLSLRFALGVLCGGLISIVNFRLLRRSLRNFFQGIAGGTKPAVMVQYYGRLVATGVVLYLLIAKAGAHVIGLLAGLSIIVISIMFAGMSMLAKKCYI